MRIRKQAKLVGIKFSNASSSNDLSSPTRLQSRICHLNQSPWDVISFPPDSASSPFQVYGEDSFAANGSLEDSIGAIESVASMKIMAEGDEKNVKKDASKQVFSIAENIKKVENTEERKDQLGRLGKGGIILCCKSDGKGWQCKKEAAQGHSLCNHHLAQLRAYNNPSGKKSEKPAEKAAAAAAAIPRCPRAKKASAGSNPHEFYYYSGFGPRWGKNRSKRAEPRSASGTKLDEVEEVVTEATPSSSSQIDHEGEFDYVEDKYDDEDNVEENGESGKKRARKPIKARSLKSLM